MLKTFTILVSFSLILISVSACSKNEESTQPIANGRFVVEAYSMTCTIKLNPNIDTLRSYLSYDLKCHFEIWPGDVEWFDVAPRGFIGMLVHAYNVSPDSVDKTKHITNGFWIGDSLRGVDSITVRTWVVGTFWNPDRSTYEWLDERTIPVIR